MNVVAVPVAVKLNISVFCIHSAYKLAVKINHKLRLPVLIIDIGRRNIQLKILAFELLRNFNVFEKPSVFLRLHAPALRFTEFTPLALIRRRDNIAVFIAALRCQPAVYRNSDRRDIFFKLLYYFADSFVKKIVHLLLLR